MSLTSEGIISWTPLPALPWSGIWMHVARGSHTYQQGGMQRLALPACTGTAILKGSRQWFVGFHSADGFSFLDWVQVSCWPNQCQPNWLQWFINHGKAGRQVRVTAPIQISLDLTSVYGRYKSLKTPSIFYEWNEYFYAIMNCSAEVTYSYGTPINFLKVGSTRTQQQAAFIVMISILETSMKPILEEALCVPIV